ncbi:winged helix-turn-helix transcriptional regulator [Rugosimonospora africana]|nr:helix-turn-helix domain-containing protein [Rugosimonospora africana]
MRPAALDFSTDNCTIGRTMEILGERWTLVVLREIFSGLRRFEEMRERTNIPRQVLANRLALLLDHGILRRHPYQEPGARARYEYRLTPKGFDLYPILVAVREWGDRYLADPEGPSLRHEHRDCGAEVRAELRCEAGHRLESARDVLPRPGPGAHLRTEAGAPATVSG